MISSYCVYVSDGTNLLSGANDNERESHVCTNRVSHSHPLPLLQWNSAISEEAKQQKRYIDSTNAGYFSWLNHEASPCQKQSCVNSPSLSFWSVTTQSLSHLCWHFHNNVCVWLCGWVFVCVNSDRLSHNTTHSWTLKVIVEVLYWLSDDWWVSLSTLIAKKPAGKKRKGPVWILKNADPSRATQIAQWDKCRFEERASPHAFETMVSNIYW